MKVLAIETSCDETAVAVVAGEKLSNGFSFQVLQSALISQANLHAEYGGVYPNLAKREHEKNLPIIFEKFTNKNIDAIAVTQGPGLEPALWSGITFAQNLAKEWQKPLIPINHMEGHLISSLAQPTENHSSILQNTRMPLLALLVSGGHTELILSKEWFRYEVIGETLDDAVGEAFDKVARMLGLPYPGGPEISKLAERVRSAKDSPLHAEESPWKLPRPMLNSKNLDFSFSGLKTAVLYALRDLTKESPLQEDEKAAFAREFEDAVADVLIAKTRKALAETGAKTFVIGGGVAANAFLRESLKKLFETEFPEVDFRLPDLSITGDNAIMIAEAALARALSGLDDTTKGEIRAVGNLSIATK